MVEFKRTFEDLVAFHMLLRERLGLSRKQKWYGLGFIVVFFGGVATWHYHSCGRLVVLPLYAACALTYTLFWYFGLNKLLERSCVRRSVRLVYGDGESTNHRLSLTESGMEEVSSEGDTFFSWSGIPEVARTDRYLFVFTGPASAHIVPLAAFASPMDAEAFLRDVQSRVARHAELPKGRDAPRPP